MAKKSSDKKVSTKSSKVEKPTKTKKTKKPSIKKGTVKKTLKKEVNIHGEGKSKSGKFLKKQRRIRMPAYFRDSWREVKKVTWPSRKESLKLSLAVIIFSGVFALIVAIADYGFNRLVERVFL